MIKKKCFLLLNMLCVFVGMSATVTADYRVTPMPDRITMQKGKPFVLDSSTVIVYDGGDFAMRRNAEFLSSFIAETTRWQPAVKERAGKGSAIVLATSPKVAGNEAYELRVAANRIIITGSSAAGVFYGIQTLRKALPVLDEAEAVELPAAIVADGPQFAYRGMMLDCGRHFFPVAFVKKFIDMLALHNMNVFHWHLTDDQGWRFEVKKYPRLTEVGSVRTSTVIGHNSDVMDGVPSGGFYTQDECREIVRYASEKFVTVIPEVDMPGHTQSALAAYPELGCTGGPYHVARHWGVHEEVLCMGGDKLDDFVSDVLDELMDVFPSPVIHIGGDECRHTRWAACPKCQALAKKLGVSVDGLQAQFTQKVEQKVEARGRRILGWDEIAGGRISGNAMVMSWHGSGPGIEAAKAGHDVVMTPKPYAYFDYYQSRNTLTEPLSIGGYVPLDSVYAYSPLAGIPQEARQHVVGVQANLWTEYIALPNHAEYMIMPRMAAMSEAQWCKDTTKDFTDFKLRLSRLTRLYDRLGYVYAHHFEREDLILSHDFLEPVSKPGNDTIYVKVKPGVHSIDAPITLTGKRSRPVVFYGEGDVKPVISGGYRVGGWQRAEGGLWKTVVPEVRQTGKLFEQFFVNGESAVRARTPNVETFHPDTVLETGIGPGKSRLRIYCAKEMLPRFANGEKPVMTAMHKWDCTRRTVDSVNVDGGYFVVHGDSMATWKPIQYSSNIFIDNYRAALDAPGEWYLEKDGTLYYMPREGEDMATAVCETSKTNRLLAVSGGGDITFRNISFQYAAYRMPEDGNSPQQGAVSMEAAIEIDSADNVRFENCEVMHTGASGIWMKRDCRDCTIVGCYIYDIGGGGIKVGDFNKPPQHPCSGITIENNIVSRVGQTLPQALGIGISHADHCKVLHNDVFDLTYSAISVGWTWGYAPTLTHDNEIAYNHLHHLGWGLMSDMGGIYTLGKSQGTRVHHNTIHDVYSYDYGGWGLYTDEGSSDITLDHNLVYGCKSGGFHQHFGADNMVLNNIFAWGITAEVRYSYFEKHLEYTFEHNIVYGGIRRQGDCVWGQGMSNDDWNCYWVTDGSRPTFGNYKQYTDKTLEQLQSNGHDQHSIVADPLFVDPVHGDFRFRSLKVARRIGFKPWDYSEAGVYGSQAWRDKAKMPKEREDAFRKMILRWEKSLPAYYTTE